VNAMQEATEKDFRTHLHKESWSKNFHYLNLA